MAGEPIYDIYRRACALLDEEGYVSEVREYSGRFMYGEYVPAIVTEAPDTLVGWAICVAHLEHLTETGEEFNLRSMPREMRRLIPKRSDSMGRDSRVFY